MPHVPLYTDAAGKVEIEAPESLIAGSMATIKVVYTAGKFGIDDAGSIKLMLRFATDSGRPQFDRPNAPNYVSATASNGAVLDLTYDPMGSERPWWKTIVIRVVKNFLKEGDRITVVLGDRSHGSAGMRVQTLRESTFEIRVQANPFGVVKYIDVPTVRTINIVPGKPVLWKAILPTLRSVGDSFRLCIKAEDICGNPTEFTNHSFSVASSHPVQGLPSRISIGEKDHPFVIEGLSVSESCDLTISIKDDAGNIVADSNPMRVKPETPLRHYWAEFHAQSEETVGTNSVVDYHVFARDRAFVDIIGHQGNDFQITNTFWSDLNAVTAEFNAPGKFVTLPGYEWSGVTPLGGDRNVYFSEEGRQIRRSSHALVPDTQDIATDCNHAAELFGKLLEAKEDCVAFAHVGGRYADLAVAHDGRIERSVEIHSSWGTFEWLLFDAFDLGYRVGVVCNSDDHKGRPGASHPGASVFGAYGGLTCVSLPALTRQDVFKALRDRRHYGTTGDRMFMDVQASFGGPVTRYLDDPAFGATESEQVAVAMMGDIVKSAARSATIGFSAVCGSPIERVDVRVGKKTVKTIRPYAASDLGARIRVIWEGADDRGRSRMSNWDGSITISGNTITDATPINFWHLDKKLEKVSDTQLRWQSVTTGNYAGVDIRLAHADDGQISIRTPYLELDFNIRQIGLEDIVFEAGGVDRKLRIFRLPEVNQVKSYSFTADVELEETGDNPLYVRVTQESGHLAWSSPIYVVK
jgi:hypothetical protein